MYVYLMKCANYYKIGHSRNPEKRRATIQTHNPLDVKICAKLKTLDALLIEKELHNKFSGRRSRGEWFELKEDDLQILQIDFGFTFKISISKIFDDDNYDRTERKKETKGLRLSNQKFNEVKDYFEEVFECEVLDVKPLKSCCVKYSSNIIYESINNLINQNYNPNQSLNNIQKFCKYQFQKINNPVEYMFNIIKAIYYKHYDLDLSNDQVIFNEVSPVLKEIKDVDSFMKNLNRQKYYKDVDEFLGYILEYNEPKIPN